jgi:hypothetical protein
MRNGNVGPLGLWVFRVLFFYQNIGPMGLKDKAEENAFVALWIMK